ncbi:O-antigen ligase family protein [Solibacillus sp. FSL W7-1436]|uniref:O-antigen ligase family protein n=1 Tax=Solibacillus sp. FSL W7-1436 TaxID=2921705 RepID=UPI0030FC898F
MTLFYEELHKSNSFDDEQENEQARANIDKWIFRILLFLIGFMPLIVLANGEEVISSIISNIDLLSSGVKGELFTHYKALLLIFGTIITSGLFLAKIIFMRGSIRKTKLNYILSLFSVVLILSTIMSPNVTIALNGQFNRSDGAISWLCYLALIFISMNIEYPKNVVRYIMYTLMPFVYVNLYIITMYFYDKNLLEQNWLQKLVSITLPAGASISEGAVLVGTLNQWNYMSGMFAILTVMFLAWSITSTRWADSILGAVTSSVSILVMFMAMSTSGFLTIIATIPFFILILIKMNGKKKAIISLLLFLSVTAPIFHILSIKNPNIWSESFGYFLKSNPYELQEVSSLIFKENTAHASESVVELPILPERGGSAGTGRLYIWEKGLGLVQDRPLLGYGMDTFMYHFPHYNIDARSGNWNEEIIVDKPHNTYLGVLYGAGLFGFLSLILIAGTTLLKFIRLLFKDTVNLIVLGIGGGAYFVQALFNDSLPSTTGVIFIIMGIFLGAILKLNVSEGEKV